MGQACCRAPGSQDGDLLKEFPGSERVLNEPFKLTQQTCGFCCMFFLYLSVVPFLFAFIYHAFPTTCLIIAALLLLCSFIPLSFNKGDTVVREPVGPLLSALMMSFYVLVLLGSIRNYYAHVQPMRALVLAREYKGVYPQLPSVAFGDASFIQFVGNTSVDVSKAVSMKSLDTGFSTFCVAPIVNQANVGRIEFWAVGADCCGVSGDKFECDDARDKSAKNAWVMKNPSDPLFDALGKYVSPYIVRRDLFMKAIAKAEHKENLSSGDQALLVRWTNQSLKDVIHKESLLVFVNLLVATLVSGVMALVLTKLSHRFGQLRKAHRWKMMGPEADLDVSARLDEFLQNVDELAVDSARWKELRPPLTATDTCLMSVTVPYVVMMLCVITTTYSSCWNFGHLIVAPFFILLGIFIVALLATPGRALNGMLIILVAMTGLYIGCANYQANMFHYCSAEDRRTYTNVMANADSKQYKDAGILKFESGAHLSQNHSVGFLYNDVTYCVAPILADDNSCSEAKTTMQHGGDLTKQPANNKKDEEEEDKAEPDEKEKSSTSDKNDEPASAMTVLRRRPPSFLQRTSRMQSPLDVDEDDFTGRTQTDADGDDYTGRTQTDAEDNVDDDTGSGGDGAISALQETPAGDSDSSEEAAEKTEETPADKKDETPAATEKEETPAADQKGKTPAAAVAAAGSVPVTCKNKKPKNAEFWAIGTNCCGARKDFNCDGGRDSDAKSGVVVRAVDNVPKAVDQPGDERDQFQNALDQAVAAFDLPVPERPVFIRWGSDAEALQKDWKKKATGIVLLTALVGLLVLTACGFGGHFYMKYSRAQESKQMEKERLARQPPPQQGMFSLSRIRDQLRV